MRAVRLLMMKVSAFLLKLLLLLALTATTSYYAYLQGARDAEKDYQEIVLEINRASLLLERQSRVVAHLSGEMAMLKLFAAARAGSSLPPLPATAPLKEEMLCPSLPKFRWRLLDSEHRGPGVLTRRK
jgi:hypothetical protein